MTFIVGVTVGILLLGINHDIVLGENDKEFGSFVGTTLGFEDLVGFPVAVALLGRQVDFLLGIAVGFNEGMRDGIAVGVQVVFTKGFIDGEAVGVEVNFRLGIAVGLLTGGAGFVVGQRVEGSSVGLMVVVRHGTILGLEVGRFESCFNRRISTWSESWIKCGWIDDNEGAKRGLRLDCN